MPVLVIARKTVGKSIGRTLKSALGIDPIFVSKPEKEITEPTHQWLTRVFGELADLIEKVCEDRGSYLRNSLAVVEVGDGQYTDPSGINPISAASDAWISVVGMLSLSFPEIHWCFYSNHLGGSSAFAQAHLIRPLHQREDLYRILELHRTRFSPLFDPTGLRALIRSGLFEEREGGEYSVRVVPVRTSLAAVMDDEEEYAYLNAYTAYKFGYRVHMLTSYSLMNSVLTKIPVDLQDGQSLDEHLSLVFEDVYLEYPDYDPLKPIALSDITKRDQRFERLTEIPQRIFMTVGHQQRSTNRKIETDNLAYIHGLRRSGQYQRTVHKPAAGIFDIWTRSGMRKRLAMNDGRALDFQWLKRSDKQLAAMNTHSVPGRLLLIAQRLLKRATCVLQSCNSVPDAILGATLALEAQEYLSSRTPTTSIESIALKHQLEVTAECMFYGIEYNMDVRSRFIELKREISSVGVWFSKAARKYSQLNAEIRIASKLLQIYRDHGQFDEEQSVLVQIRKLHRQLWYRSNRRWAWMFYPVRCYVEFLLGSLPTFTIGILFWITAFTIMYGFVYLHGATGSFDQQLLHGLSDAVTAFLGMQPPHDINTLIEAPGGKALLCLTIVAILASFIHLGIFVSHVYAMVTRR